MIFAGFDVEEVPADVFGDGTIGNVGAVGSEFAYYPPDDHPDGLVVTWTVGAGIDAISFVVAGAYGAGADEAPGINSAQRVRYIYTRRWPVAPGDQLVMAAGGPAADVNGFYPTRGNGPLWGGEGWADTSGTVPFRYGGAGGGASALWINGALVALSGGQGGWMNPVTGGSAGLWVPPTNGLPTGAGPLTRGEPADASIDAVSRGGSGGGAPGGTAAGLHEPGLNGTSVVPDPDAGGPESPTWEEIGWDPEGDPADGPGLFLGGLVSVHFYVPRTRVINVGFIGVGV